MIYPPQEDSLLLQKHVKEYANGLVLDIGCGSGIQAITSSEKKEVTRVLATDLFKKAGFSNTKITYIQSNMFARIPKQKFDTIIFNPPYLPQEDRKRKVALEGGKHGWELLKKFLENAGRYLNNTGILLVVFSSLTDKNVVDELIAQNAFGFELLEQKNFFFEKLYCYKIFRQQWFIDLSKKRVKDPAHFAKGKRGRIFVATYNKKMVAVKIKNELSQTNRLLIEVQFLKISNKHGIGPKLLNHSNNFIAYEFVRGKHFEDVLKEQKSPEKIIMALLQQARIMDDIGFSKEEMHRPYKNVIIRQNKPVLIDFERSHFDKNPKNVTQLCSFITNHFSIDLRKEAENYKRHMNNASFTRIISKIQNK